MGNSRNLQLRLISLVLAIWVLPINSFAEFKATVDVEVTSDAPVVTANDKKNTLSSSNAKAEYRITIVWNGAEKVTDMKIVSGTYNFGSLKNQTFTKVETSENAISIPITLDLKEVREYSFDYSLQIEYKLTIEKEGKEPEITTANESIEGASKETIQVWPAPIVLACKTKFDAMLPGEKVNFEVKSSGGVEDGWKFDWTAGTPKGSPATKCEYLATTPQRINNGFEQQQITVNYINIAPDKKTTWYEGSITFNVDVYHTPKVVQGSSPNGAYSTEVLKYEVMSSGGNPGAWVYAWSDGQSVGNISEIKAVNVNDTPISKEVKVTAKNTSPESKVWYEKEFIWPLTIYPAPQVSSPEELPKDVFSGHSIPIELTVKGGQADAWTYKWYVDEMEQPENNYNRIFNFKVNNNDIGPIAQKVKVEATNNAAGVITPYTETFEYDFIIWPGNEMVAYSGQSISIGTSRREGYTYSWKKNGSMIANEGSTFTIVVTNNNTDGSCITDIYTLSEINQSGESEEYEYKISVYPEPSIELVDEEFNFYYGETAKFVNAKGGYPDGWEIYYDGSTDDVIIEDGDINGCKRIVKVTARNYYHNLKWFDKEIDIQYNAWSKGNISGKLNRVEYNGFADFELIATPTGGYPDGWTFSWTKNGIAVDNADTNLLKIDEYNSEAEVKRYTYVLTAKNNIDERIGLEKEVKFTFNVWPTIQLPAESDIQVSETKIRQGNNLTIRIPEAAGGYEYTWEYDWRINDEQIGKSNEISLKLAVEAGNTMQKMSHDYSLRITNPGPIGEAPWVDVIYHAPEVIVYRRPHLPSSLTRKGNGASCTMIVLQNEYNDEQLSQYKYRYVFGYTDKNGVDHFMPETENRYYQFDKVIFDNSDNTFWVLSQWNYEDGSKVTSGKRFLNGSKNDDFDASKYETVNSGSGRGEDEAGLNEVCSDSYVQIDNNGFVASTKTPQNAVVDVHSIDGVNIIHQVYPPNTYFNEPIDTQDLAPGMYIIKVHVGDMVDVKKVVIK
ncbi:MAG: T9SS type A sorting domain-containing protein [Bacteroidales bacterium]|nr:T9SS type A sorting domain-containing protein [Bacteroidales bacterium]